MPKQTYSPAVKDNCFKLFCRGMSVTQIAEESGITPGTIRAWQKNFAWDERKAEVTPYLPVPLENELIRRKEEGKQKGLSDADLDSLEHIKIVEEMCMCVIKGEIPDWITEENSKRAYVPMNFKEATDALHKCWAAKERIIARTAPKEKPKNGSGFGEGNTFNIIAMVKASGMPDDLAEAIDIGGQD